MENESRRRRRLAAAGTECSRGGATRAAVLAGATTIHDLADELLELVLLRVSSRHCLVRAAAACRPWRSLIAADGFLRRFRSVHAPIVLGHFYAGARTAFVPSHTPLGKSVAGGDISSRVSLDFLLRKYGGIGDLFLSDCHGGILAFIRSDSSVVLCDPWTKQYRVLLPPSTPPGSRFFHGAFLLDADEIGTARVLYVCGRYNYDEQDRRITARVSVFSATADDHWLLLASTVIVDDPLFMAALCLGVSGQNMSKVGGSIFWSVKGFYVFQLNQSTGAFSSFSMPPGLAKINWNNNHGSSERRKLRVVVGRDDRAARAVCIVDEELQVLRLVHGGGMCVEEKRVNLSELCNNTEVMGPDRSWHFLELSENVAPGCIVLSPSEKCTWMFYVDVESMEVERVKRRNWHYRALFPYELPWTPTIKACL